MASISSGFANLLLTLHALLEECDLTHAGERMTMSQSAMSGALTRLRRHFDDDLLVREGRGFVLSPLAGRLRPAVAERAPGCSLALDPLHVFPD
ncbi:LysR family transcriptional regulator, partial [Actinoplanes philippinensis]|uniref:LysR family transcriptional regulator n=1 Tax=Actinoplanes philippinensis TaxID=35752 RepID=UPI0033D83825